TPFSSSSPTVRVGSAMESRLRFPPENAGKDEVLLASMSVEGNTGRPGDVPFSVCIWRRRRCSLSFSWRVNPLPVLRLQSAYGHISGFLAFTFFLWTSRWCLSRPPEYVKPWTLSHPGSRHL